MSGVITSASALRSPSSYAACSLRNCSFACSANAAASKPGGNLPVAAAGAGPAVVAPITGSKRAEAAGAGSSVGSTRGDVPVLAPAPAYCSGRAGCARRDSSMRTRNTPPTTSSASSRKLANPSDRPKCDSSAASPRPAARPAIGPSQRDAPAAAGARGAAWPAPPGPAPTARTARRWARSARSAPGSPGAARRACGHRPDAWRRRCRRRRRRPLPPAPPQLPSICSSSCSPGLSQRTASESVARRIQARRRRLDAARGCVTRTAIWRQAPR